MTEYAPTPVMEELQAALYAPEYEQPEREQSWSWWHTMARSGAMNMAIISDVEQEREFVLRTAAYLNAVNDIDTATQLLDFTARIWRLRFSTTHPQVIALQGWRAETQLKSGAFLFAQLLVENNEQQLSSALAQSPGNERLVSEMLAIGRQKAICLAYRGEVAAGRELASAVHNETRSWYGEADPRTVKALRVGASFDFMAGDDEMALRKLCAVESEIATANEGAFTTAFVIDAELAKLRARRELDPNPTPIHARQQVLEDQAVALLGRESHVADVAAADRLNTTVRVHARHRFGPLVSDRRAYELWAMLG